MTKKSSVWELLCIWNTIHARWTIRLPQACVCCALSKYLQWSVIISLNTCHRWRQANTFICVQAVSYGVICLSFLILNKKNVEKTCSYGLSLIVVLKSSWCVISQLTQTIHETPYPKKKLLSMLCINPGLFGGTRRRVDFCKTHTQNKQYSISSVNYSVWGNSDAHSAEQLGFDYSSKERYITGPSPVFGQRFATKRAHVLFHRN